MARLRTRDAVGPWERRRDVVCARTRATPPCRESLSREASRRDVRAHRGTRRLKVAPPFLRSLEGTEVREVEMQRCHRYVSLLDRAEIGILLTRPRDRATADPVDRPSPWILHRRYGLGGHAPSQSRELHTANICRGNRRQIHVEQRIRGEAVKRREVLQQWREDFHLFVEVKDVGAQIAGGRERDCDRRDPQRQSLHGRGDRARVQHVFAHVVAVIDPAQDEVWPCRHQRLDREHHAVGRCAVDLPAPFAATDGTQRMMDRERVARGALLAIRRDDRHFPQRLRCLDETLDAVRENAVVVRYEETHSVGSVPQSASCLEPSVPINSLSSASSDSSDCTVNAPRATTLRSPPFRCSSTFWRAPSMVYFSSYSRCFTSMISSTSRR